MYVDPHCPQESFLSHHWMKDVTGGQNEWVHRTRMTDMRQVFILSFENGDSAIDLSDRTHRSSFRTAVSYLRRYRWFVNPLQYWLWACALLPLWIQGALCLMGNFRRSENLSLLPFRTIDQKEKQFRWPFPVTSEVLCPATRMLGCNCCCMSYPVSVGPQFISHSGETQFYLPCLPEL